MSLYTANVAALSFLLLALLFLFFALLAGWKQLTDAQKRWVRRNALVAVAWFGFWTLVLWVFKG